MSAYLPASAVVTVDLSAIQANYRYMQSISGVRVDHAAVVKSDAYGLGLVPVAKALVQSGCSFFFVGNLEEALVLRSACPKVSIAVLRGDIGKYGAVYVRHRLTPVINSDEEMELVRSAFALLPFILNIDTGLTRLGLSADKVRSLYLSGAFERVQLRGIMSHLACSAQADHPSNELQRNRFAALYGLIRPRWGSLVASAGVWLGNSYHFDMTRLGSALYGLNDPRIRPNPLRPVLRLSAPIVELRDLCSREAVGYGATFRADRNSRIAIVGMGYRHGLPWTCGNKIAVHIGPFPAPVIGRISMEYLAIDVTGIPEAVCHPGAWADLLDETFGPDDMADAIGIAAQEVMLRVGGANARQYLAARPAKAAETRAAS
jgi:alanine racemase